MTGFGETIDQPASPVKLPSLTKLIRTLGFTRRPQATTKTATTEGKKNIGKEDWNMLASRILQTERDIAVTQIVRRETAPHKTDSLTHAPRRDKIRRTIIPQATRK